MFFICFDGDHRNTIVKNIIYHFDNFKIKYWYDNYNLLLGDNKKQEIFNNGINKSKYAIIIYTKEFFTHPSSVAEESYLLNLYLENKIRLLPILYNIDLNSLPIKTRDVIENIIYNVIDDSSNLYLTLNQIFIIILKEKLGINLNTRFDLKNVSLIEKDCFIRSQMDLFKSMDEFEKNMKIVILKCIYDYMYYSKKYSIHKSDSEHKIFTYLINKIHFRLEYDFKEIELLSLVIFNYLCLGIH